MNANFSIEVINPNDKKATAIIDELSENLLMRFGSDGRNSFIDWENDNLKFVFAVAAMDSEIVGCGAIRPIAENTAEIKRMYAKYSGSKIGKRILDFLESKAKQLNYTNLVLETRLKNEQAILFYKKQGYTVIPNYGKYLNRPEAVCLGKSLL
ncbi:GNAT family N-acetyltransferase [Flavobacterium hungaricum]|uniref:GNAT family N-acetyltransferase n=1 Tax=Flavobacterium hungaricum TaxID=2082725 RepID=A0ABR9TR73_9FLAO|nr:GNAT family N-acetyltransferase [Flavobacterium hungaricum]MBE8727877.1 GNAT family N-acetyltransferase [Flavobacterium hungaricum]